MKRRIKCYLLSMIVALFFTISYCSAQNQTDTLTYLIETNDGNTYMGKILAKDSVKIQFNSDKLGELNILRSDIKKIDPLDMKKVKGDKYWYDNPQSTRYFFSPNGYGLEKGEGYYQNVWVLINSFAVGINDYISVGGGMVPLFLFAGTATPAWLSRSLVIWTNS